jgi:hypothetical protein
MKNEMVKVSHLVMLGRDIWSFLPGQSLVLKNDSPCFANDYLDIIANALRAGCSLIQAVKVEEDEMDKLSHELHLLALPDEAFHIRKIERESDFPNWEISLVKKLK